MHQHKTPVEVIKISVIKSSPPIDPQFNAKELEKPNVNTKGYITRQIPGELVFDFGGQYYDVSLLQILSHEKKIASRIDVLVSQDAGKSYKLLGCIEFEDNSKSGYCARELQSVQINEMGCSLLKLVLHQPHANEFNKEGQVGVVGLNVLGWKSLTGPPVLEVKSSPMKPAAVVIDTEPPPPAIKAELLQVKDILNKAEELRRLKEAAAEREAFEDAAEFKRKEAEYRRLGQLANDLEEAKSLAIQKEDYDEAKRIKQQLADVFQQVSHQNGEAHYLPKAHNTLIDKKPASPAISLKKTPQKPQEPATTRSKEDEPIVVSNNSARKTNIRIIDDAVEVAPDNFFPQSEGEELLPLADPLPSSIAALPETKRLVDDLGMYTVRCLYSSDLKLRAAIFQKLLEDVRNNKDNDSLLDSLLQSCILGLSDQTPHIFMAAVSLTKELLDRVPGELVKMSPFSHSLVSTLVETSSNNTSSVFATNTGLLLGRLIQILHPNTVLRILLQTKVNKKSTLWKPLQTRLSLMLRCVSVKDFDVSPWVRPVVVDYLSEHDCFAHANEHVREAALLLTGELYANSGNSDRAWLYDYVKTKLRPALFDKYNQAFAKANPLLVPPASSATKPHLTLTMELDDNNNNNKLEETNQEDEDPSVCQFCRRGNPAFVETKDGLDIHYYRDCPMLTKCPKCLQIIEISHLNEHLLRECEMRSNHKQCPRCREAIAGQYFDQHVARKDCLEAQPSNLANRCPLCHQDIPPFDNGWRIHLLHSGCPKNSRNQVFLEFDDTGDD